MRQERAANFDRAPRRPPPRHPMADRRLQVFYTVARQLSFTRAAEQLCMTQPAVTFQIKQLEEHFDARLFERARGGIVLTPTGEIVLQYAERILELGDELDKRVGEMHGSISGPLLLRFVTNSSLERTSPRRDGS